MPTLNYSVTLVGGANENVNDVETKFAEVRAVVNALDNANFNPAGTPLDYAKLNLAGQIRNADVKADAAIAFSKLAALPAGNILVGSAGNVATAVNPSGEVDIDSAGVMTVQDGVIDYMNLVSALKAAFSETEVHRILTAPVPTSAGNIAQVTVDVPAPRGVVELFAYFEVAADGTASGQTVSLDLLLDGAQAADVEGGTFFGILGGFQANQKLRLALGTLGWGTTGPGAGLSLNGVDRALRIDDGPTDVGGGLLFSLEPGARTFAVQVSTSSPSHFTMSGFLFARTVAVG